MDLRDFLKKQLNEETTQTKKTYSIHEETNDAPVDDAPPEGWTYIGPEPPSPDNYSLVLQQLKKEFALVATQMIINPPRIIDMPTATDQAVELKRRGEYVKSSRFYADYMRDNGILSPMMAMAWFKCLAAGGDTQDALILADYLMSRNPPDCYATNMLKQHMNIFLSVYIEFVFSKMQTTPRIGFWLDNSNQTPQQTVETILNVRKPV